MKSKYIPGEIYGVAGGVESSNGRNKYLFAIVQKNDKLEEGVDFRMYHRVGGKLVYFKTVSEQPNLQVMDESDYERIKSNLNKSLSMSKIGLANALLTRKNNPSRIDFLKAEGKLETISRGVSK